jgi:hypothetical protein
MPALPVTSVIRYWASLLITLEMLYANSFFRENSAQRKHPGRNFRGVFGLAIRVRCRLIADKDKNTISLRSFIWRMM